MTLLVVFLIGAVLSWACRAMFVVLLPAGPLAMRVTSGLRYAAPAAFASIVASSAAAQPHWGGWRFAVAALVAALIGWRFRNLAITTIGGAAAMALLTAL
jgi:branched-subunit amino acid transport protein